MDFCETFWEFFLFFSKIKNGPLSGPIYHQIHLDRVKKTYATMTSKEKLEKMYISDLIFFWNFITHFLQWSEGHFSKYQNMWINENLSIYQRSAKLPVILFFKGVSGWMQIFLLLNISVPGGLNFLGDFVFGLIFDRSQFDQPWSVRISN
jgi:hypothetical protein